MSFQNANFTINVDGPNGVGVQHNNYTSNAENKTKNPEAETQGAHDGSLSSRSSETALFNYTDFADPQNIASAFRSESKDAKSKNEAIPRYELGGATSKKAGKAVIINIKFVNQSNERKGSEIDVDKMKALWSELGFEVEIFDSPLATTSVTIRALLQQLSQQYGGITVIIVMSHGKQIKGKDAFKTSDGKYIYFDDVVTFFDNKNAKSLRGLPKIFLAQFCRGPLKDFGVEEDEDSEDESLAREFSLLSTVRDTGEHDEDVDEDEAVLQPIRSDMVIVHASMSGYKAMRNPENGSYFFNAIANVFSSFSRSEHILNLMTRVNATMAEKTYVDKDGKTRKQMGEVQYSLTKHLYLTK